MYPGGFDPSKMDPKTLMKISELVRQLPPEKLSRMQTLMHNMMAGFDVRKEMEEFEKGLPPGFREQMMSSFLGTELGAGLGASGASSPFTPPFEETPHTLEGDSSTDSVEMNLREARLTLLRAVAQGEMQPEDAERLLFPEKMSEIAEGENSRARA